MSGTGCAAQNAISASSSEDPAEDVVDMLEVIAEIEALGERGRRDLARDRRVALQLGQEILPSSQTFIALRCTA